MKYTLGLFLLILCVSVQGQVDKSVFSDLEANEIERAEAAITIENGNDNSVSIEQVGSQKFSTYILGSQNKLAITQAGREAFLLVSQTGDLNLVESIDQGSYNRILISQNGDNNSVTQYLEGTFDGNYEIIQIGNNHNLIHENYGGRGEEMMVKMTGNGMDITIETKN